jgi:citrate synthase
VTERVHTDIGAANAERVTLRGHDLVEELIGRVSFTAAALLAITGRMPSPAEERVADAVLVTFIDHGLQPSALVARLTYYVAPEAVQGGVAAGLLGVGSRILGTLEDAGHLLVRVADEVASGRSDDEAVATVVSAEIRAGRHIPGLGHALHRNGDPRVGPLLKVAADEGIADVEVRRLQAIVAEVNKQTGRTLPVNAAGVSAALLLGIGFPWWLQRGFPMISRAAGLVAHIGEEAERPIAPAVRELLRTASWLDED